MSRSMGEHFAIVHLGVEVTVFCSEQSPFWQKMILRLGTTYIILTIVKEQLLAFFKLSKN